MARNNLIKAVDHSLWGEMCRKLQYASDEKLQELWAEIEGYDPRAYYLPGITMDSRAQAISSEMSMRSIPYKPHKATEAKSDDPSSKLPE